MSVSRMSAFCWSDVVPFYWENYPLFGWLIKQSGFGLFKVASLEYFSRQAFWMNKTFHDTFFTKPLQRVTGRLVTKSNVIIGDCTHLEPIHT